MDQHGCNRLGGMVFVVALSVISAATVFGEERPHPSLVDPAITKCTVCHKDVSATHSMSASGQPCLSCHTFAKRANKTVVVVDNFPRSMDSDDVQMAVEPGSGGIERNEESPPDSSDAITTPSEPQSVEVVYEIAPVFPTPAAPSETHLSERQEAAVSSGDEEPAGRLYAEGMAAFNRREFDRAFQTWRSMLAEKTEHYVVQVEVDTYLESAEWTLATYGGYSLYVLKKDDLFWVFSGFFATRAEAIEAVKLLPEPLRQGGAFQTAVREILPQQ